MKRMQITYIGYVMMIFLIGNLGLLISFLLGDEFQPYNSFNAVCIAPNSYSNNKNLLTLKLTAYDSKAFNGKGSKPYVYTINRLPAKYDDNWIIDVKQESDFPSDWKVLPVVAYFTSYWRDWDQIFLLWYDILPSVSGQFVWSEKQQHLQNSERVLIVPELKNMSEHFRHVIKNFGFKDIHDFAYYADNGPICFKHAVFGHSNVEKKYQRENIVEIVTDKFESQLEPCGNRYVLVIQRMKTRRILNIDQLEKILREKGYNDIRIEQFESRPIFEQYKIVRCASMLIGAQGAALSWYDFLPKHATLIEIRWNGWPMRFQERAQLSRPDITSKVIICTAKTPLYVWQKYAKLWLGYTSDTITKDIKKRLTWQSARESARKHIADTPFKDSDCVCSENVFKNAIPNP